MTSLLQPTDHWALWAIMIGGTGAAIWLEQTQRWAAKLSGPVVALLIAITLSNTRIMPTDAPAYDFVGDWLVPLAIPLLLFRANALQIFRSTGRVMVCFHIAAVGTLLGTVLAWLALRQAIGDPAVAHASGIMAASYIGGGVNFFAVKTSYAVGDAVTNPLLVADNFVMAGMFVALLGIAASSFFRKHFPHPHTLDADVGGAENLAAKHWQRKGISLLDLAKALAFAFMVVAAADLTGRLTRAAFGDVTRAGFALQMLQVLCTNKFVLITAMSLALATLLHQPLAHVNGPEEIGTYLLYLFLFVIGLPADVVAVLFKTPLFFVFCGIIAVVNLAFTLLVGKMFRLPLEELLLSVNATLGGAPSAAAMATSCGWSRLILPGILAGIWGYVIGTPIGVLVVEMLKR
ncbi:MAG: DUF819 family protein [Verrucomicrobia bacterium]|nr:DUF819 family protein [Verrucomicrobiota bacterium]